MKFIEAWITKHWYKRQKTCLAYLLWPLSIMFEQVIAFRRWMYKRHFLNSYRAPCSVIVVGNISVGGVGKTPFVIALYFFLKKHGWIPGIVTRGYQGKYTGVAWVNADSDPADVGDEAVLLALRTEAPLVVSRDRAKAIQTLLNNSHCNIILSDDGLQHYAIQRDIEIAIIDGVKQHGNKLCLPAGPLREPISRLQSVDIVVENGGDSSLCRFDLRGKELVNILDHSIRMSIDVLQGKVVHAFAAIGSPQRFFNDLKNFGINVIEHPYPDHYFFQKKDFSSFSSQDILLMTEKDMVKCRRIMQKNAWFLPVEAQFNVVLLQACENALSHLAK